MGWKRTVAAIVLAALGACEPARERAAPSTPAPDDLTASTRRVALEVVADFSVEPAAPGAELTTVEAEALRAGEGSAVVVAVERPKARPGCIADVRLRLFLEEWSDVAADELAVYPSHVFDARRKADGDSFGYSGSLLDVRPRATFEGVAEGWGEWDVTRIVKPWIGGWTFPSRGHRAPARGPVVLALRDAELAEPFATATIASLESARPPRAFAFVEERCPSRGRA